MLRMGDIQRQKEDGLQWLPLDPNFATKAIHTAYVPKDWNYAPVTPPLVLSTTYEQDGPAQHRGFPYIRCGNPTRLILEATLATLDGAKHGMVYSSGVAAINNILSLLDTGDHLISMDDVYGGTGSLFRQFHKNANIQPHFVDLTDLSAFEKALTPKIKLVWIETPTNPTLKIVDIAKVTEIAHKYNKAILVVVDNTFLTCFYQKPIDFGVDLVMCSLTKYINGHSDVCMGAVTYNRDDLKERLLFLQEAIGATPSPFDCYLVLRSLRTLHVRMPLHMKNAFTIAKFLSSHPKVEKVLHPGLPSHPQHQLALKQSAGHSGLISFYLKAGGSGERFLKNIKIFALAESLGGHESLAELPYCMTHECVPADLRIKLGITDELVRISIGLESVEDLIKDLDDALNQC